MKFGRVRSIFGVVSLNPIIAYTKLSRLGNTRGLIVAHVDRSPPPDADILIFDGLYSLTSSVSTLHTDMVIVLCAGPLQLETIPDIKPIDYTIDDSYEIELVSPDYMKVIRSATKGSGCVRIRPTSLNHVLPSIIEATVESGAILLELNALLSMCNNVARSMVRDELVKVFNRGGKDVAPLLTKLDNISDKSIQGRVDGLKKAIDTDDFRRLALAVKTLSAGKSNAASLGSKHKLEAFEISYFGKMCAHSNIGSNKKG